MHLSLLGTHYCTQERITVRGLLKVNNSQTFSRSDEFKSSKLLILSSFNFVSFFVADCFLE